MRVNLENLRAEMVLDADIVDGSGRLLLPSGTALTDKHLRYCQMWGIVDAEIRGEETGEAVAEPVIDPVRLAAAEVMVASRFVHTDRSHPAIDALYRYAVQLELKRATT